MHVFTIIVPFKNENTQRESSIPESYFLIHNVPQNIASQKTCNCKIKVDTQSNDAFPQGI